MALVGKSYLNLKDWYSQQEGGKVTSTIIDLFVYPLILGMTFALAGTPCCQK